MQKLTIWNPEKWALDQMGGRGKERLLRDDGIYAGYSWALNAIKANI